LESVGSVGVGFGVVVEVVEVVGLEVVVLEEVVLEGVVLEVVVVVSSVVVELGGAVADVLIGVV